jgi:hypothetical protein
LYSGAAIAFKGSESPNPGVEVQYLKTFAAVALMWIAASPSYAGLITYNLTDTATYTVNIDDTTTAGRFTIAISVGSGFQANVLAFGFNNGDIYNNETDLGLSMIDPAALASPFPQFFFDTGDCGQGCNFNGGGNPTFDTIIRLQSQGLQGADALENIKFSILKPTGATLSIFGLGGIRAQSVGAEPCTATSCEGSDKALGTPTTPPTQVPEPGTLSLLGAGLVCLGLLRRRRAA